MTTDLATLEIIAHGAQNARELLAQANARIAELVKERDEALAMQKKVRAALYWMAIYYSVDWDTAVKVAFERSAADTQWVDKVREAGM